MFDIKWLGVNHVVIHGEKFDESTWWTVIFMEASGKHGHGWKITVDWGPQT